LNTLLVFSHPVLRELFSLLAWPSKMDN
jgi:hypothetical protein